MNRHEWLTVLVIDLANGVAAFDTGVMNLILPTVSITLRAPVQIVLWVPLVALIARSAFMPALGRYADVHGRKRQLVAGLLVFSTGSLLAATSSTIYELILYRVLQGIGAASILAVGRAMIVDGVAGEHRGYALGTNVSAIYLATTLGTAVSGSIISFTSYTGWEDIFRVTGVAGLAIVPLALLTLKETGGRRDGGRMDWPGSFLLAAAIGASLVTVTAGVLTGFGVLHFFVEYIRIPILGFYVYTFWSVSLPVVWLAAASVALAALFFYRELTAERPLLDFRLFASNVSFTVTNMAAFLVYVGTYSLLILLSFYFEVIRGLPPLTSGLVLALQPLAVTVFAVIGGRLSSRFDKRDLEFAGLATMLACLFMLATTGTTTDVWLLSALLVGLGAGFGVFSPNNTNLNLSSVGTEDRSLANGILGMMRHSGQTVSLGIATVALDVALFGEQGQGAFRPAQYVASLDLTFLLGAALVLIPALALVKFRSRVGVAPDDKIGNV
ncbi:MAG: MFS transporter [Nitrososphaerota archaeon]|nr:MFS transporter [Nitrososphaerota archaeon]